MQIKKILHLGDIHFTLYKNHEQLYSLIDRLKSDIIKNKIDLVYIGGDVVHEFNKLSPELVSLLEIFFKEVSELAPIILILGNHDWNANNPDRLDSLTPIISNNPRIHYLKYTGVYKLYDINWCVWSEYDDFTLDEILETIKHIPGYRIGCYHGVLSGCKLYSGEVMESAVSVETFNQCDTVFLADIHNRQYFRNNDIAYCGSLYQVSWGETDDEEKGGIIWEWNEKKQKFYPKDYNIKTDYFLKTIRVTNCNTFKLQNDYLEGLKKKYKHLKLRLIFSGQQDKYDRILFNNIEKQLQPYSQYKIIKKREWEKISKDTKKISEISSQDYFKKWLDGQKVPQNKIDLLKKLDSDYTAKLPSSDRDFSVCDVKSLELSYFGPFGPKQLITFDDYNGLTGIVAENMTGKSFVLCGIAYAIWGHTFRDVSKDLHLVHKLVRNEQGGGVKILLSKDGLEYEIERFIEKSGRVNLNFVCVDTHTSKNGKDRFETQKEIVKVFGDFDSFLLSNFYSANNGKDFLKLKQGARYDYFTDIMNLNEWELKHEIANKDLLLKEKEKAILESRINNIQLFEQSHYDKQLGVEDINIQLLESDKFLWEQKLESKKKDLYTIKIDKDVQPKWLYERKVLEAQTKIEFNNDKIRNANELLLGSAKLLETYLLGKTISDYLSDLKTEKQIAANDSKDYTKQIDELKNGICSACQRPLVDKTKDEIDKEITELELKVQAKKQIIRDNTELIDRIESLSKDLEDSKRVIETRTKDLDFYQKQLDDNQLILDTYVDQEELVKTKNKLEEEIKEINQTLYTINDKIKTSLQLTAVINQSIKQNNENIKLNQKLTEESSELSNQIDLLEIYCNAVHKKGVRKLIIEDTIESINDYLNSCLVDYNFEIELLVNEKNEVEVLFIDESGVEQSATQCSGMETFIVNLSLRNAFNQITKKDKFNCFIIDEGFGTLDPINLENCFTFLDKLKEYYDKIIIISHVDTIKAWLDNTIELEKVNGFTIIKN